MVDIRHPDSPLALRTSRKRSLSSHDIDDRVESYGNLNHSVKVFLDCRVNDQDRADRGLWPSIFGIWMSKMSKRIRWGRPSITFSSASTPSPAALTSYPFTLRSSRRSSTTLGSSSANDTRPAIVTPFVGGDNTSGLGIRR